MGSGFPGMVTPPWRSALVIFCRSVFRPSKVTRIVCSATIATPMIPSTPLRIELILAKGPHEVQPGMVKSKVCSAAASGPASTKTSMRPARRPKIVFPFIMTPSQKESKNPSRADSLPLFAFFLTGREGNVQWNFLLFRMAARPLNA